MVDPEMPHLGEAHQIYRARLRDRIQMLETQSAEMSRQIDRLITSRHRAEAELTSLEVTLKAVEALSPILSGHADEIPPEPTNFERMAKAMQDQTEPWTIADIEKITGINRSSVSAILYRTHPGDFARLEQEGSRANLWWLKSALEAKMQAESSDSQIPF
jgi:hypothetical protein